MGDPLALDQRDERHRVELRKITEVHPSYIPAVAQPPPPMWNSGIAMRLTADSSLPDVLGGWQQAEEVRVRELTPFGRPVVPDEYSWNAVSSGAGIDAGIVGRIARDPVAEVLVVGIARSRRPS